jgi:hypothetical protein
LPLRCWRCHIELRGALPDCHYSPLMLGYRLADCHYSAIFVVTIISFIGHRLVASTPPLSRR